MRVTVTAHARLHLGFFNVDGSLGHMYGGLGVALSAPGLKIVAESARAFSAEGAQAAKATAYARKLSAALGVPFQAKLFVEETLPEHSGLGSGTQWALAVGTALTVLAGTPLPPRELARLFDRGMRSGIGVAGFESGGCIMEAGHPPEAPARPSPVILRRDFPPGWRFVLVLPETEPGLFGHAEKEAFARFDETGGITEDIAGAICRAVLLRLLPALLEEDIAAFGQAVTDLDRHTGLFFKKSQGGVYRDTGAAQVDRLLAAGAYGAGQSSWGPCLYALVDDANEADVMIAAQSMLAEMRTPGRVFVAKVRNRGADVVIW